MIVTWRIVLEEQKDYQNKKVACNALDRVWDLYLEGKLRSENLRRIAEHLIACKGCDEKIKERASLCNLIIRTPVNEIYKNLSNNSKEMINRGIFYNESSSRESMN